MSKPELGVKRRCLSCAAPFFDLNRTPIVWLDTSKVRSAKYRPMYKVAFWVFVVTGIGLAIAAPCRRPSPMSRRRASSA